MVKDQPYYYTDSNFQLELNLQEIRLELILMLDDFEATGCFVCNKLKCCCKEQSISTLSEFETDTDSRKSIKSQESVPKTDLEIPEVSIAPAANTVPFWDTEEDFSAGTLKSEHLQYKEVEAWVRSSTPNADKSEQKKTKAMDNTFTCEEKEERTPDLLNHSWPLPKSNLEKKLDLNTMTGKCEPNNAVDTFFKCFRKSQRPVFAEQLIGQNSGRKLVNALIIKKPARNEVTSNF